MTAEVDLGAGRITDMRFFSGRFFSSVLPLFNCSSDLPSKDAALRVHILSIPQYSQDRANVQCSCTTCAQSCDIKISGISCKACLLKNEVAIWLHVHELERNCSPCCKHVEHPSLWPDVHHHEQPHARPTM